MPDEQRLQLSINFAPRADLQNVASAIEDIRIACALGSELQTVSDRNRAVLRAPLEIGVPEDVVDESRSSRARSANWSVIRALRVAGVVDGVQELGAERAKSDGSNVFAKEFADLAADKKLVAGQTLVHFSDSVCSTDCFAVGAIGLCLDEICGLALARCHERIEPPMECFLKHHVWIAEEVLSA